MVLWERPSKFKDKKGYLYLRETIYVRDGRTLKRSRNSFDGTATKERGKYSKKKDIYCGKIIEPEMKKILDFRQFIESKGIDYLKFKTESSFDKILDNFVEFLLEMYGLDKKNVFNSKKKQAFQISTGFLCPQTIDFVKKYSPRSQNVGNPKDLERFSNRCLDTGIFDEEVIMSLYLKLFPEEDVKDFKKEIEELEEHKLDDVSTKNLYGFLKDY